MAIGTGIVSAIQVHVDSLRARSFSPATVHNAEMSLSVFCEFLAARSVELPERVTPNRFHEYQSYLAATRHNAQGTIRMRLLTLRRFLEFLADQRLVPSSLGKGLHLPQLPAQLPRLVLNRKQARAVLAAPDLATATGIRNSAMLEVLYSTGIRLSELALLKVTDVHLAENLIHVRHAKFNRDRLVPLGQTAADRLRAYLKLVRPKWLGADGTATPLWLSAIHPHQPIAPPAVACIVRRVAKVAGIRAVVSPHVWRHTCATHLVRRGAPLPCVQRLLGHRSLNTTQLYTRVAITDLQRTFVRTHPRARERNPHVPTPRFDQAVPPTP